VSGERPEERAPLACLGECFAPNGTPETWAVLVAELRAEVDRLRHGEKVRDGMLRRFVRGWAYTTNGASSWVGRDPLTPDEVAVLAALDTEEDTEQ
jgi:hypothetical protein